MLILLSSIGRDSSGFILHVYGTPCHALSPLHAEVLAIHSVCHLASCRGWYHAIVKSDSQLAISLSYTETVPPWSIAALVDDIRLWSKNMDLSFSWTSRDNNQLAHYAARLASSSTFHFSWDASFPHELTSIASTTITTNSYPYKLFTPPPSPPSFVTYANGVDSISTHPLNVVRLEARLAMEKNPDDHPCESAAILHELINEMENLRVE
ncbi:reverse transcriptase [Tanacetum coccineum]